MTTRSLAAIDADLAEVEATLYAEDTSLRSDHARMATLHDRASKLWRERLKALEGWEKG